MARLKVFFMLLIAALSFWCDRVGQSGSPARGGLAPGFRLIGSAWAEEKV